MAQSVFAGTAALSPDGPGRNDPVARSVVDGLGWCGPELESTARVTSPHEHYQSQPRSGFLSREELDAVIQEAFRTSFTGLHPAMAFGAFAGLHRSEITNLRSEDIHLDLKVIRVRNHAHDRREVRTKNQEDCLVPARPRIAGILREVWGFHLTPRRLDGVGPAAQSRRQANEESHRSAASVPEALWRSPASDCCAAAHL